MIIFNLIRTHVVQVCEVSPVELGSPLGPGLYFFTEFPGNILSLCGPLFSISNSFRVPMSQLSVG